MDLTLDQANQLADKYKDLADSILKQNLEKLRLKQITPAESEKLDEAESEARRLCSLFTTEAVGMIIDDTVASLEQLSEVTDKANKAIKHLASVNKVINIATSAVKLGVAVMSQNPGAITSSLADLNTQLNT
jgi:hypothetical protein